MEKASFSLSTDHLGDVTSQLRRKSQPYQLLTPYLLVFLKCINYCLVFTQDIAVDILPHYIIKKEYNSLVASQLKMLIQKYPCLNFLYKVCVCVRVFSSENKIAKNISGTSTADIGGRIRNQEEKLLFLSSLGEHFAYSPVVYIYHDSLGYKNTDNISRHRRISSCCRTNLLWDEED